MTTSLETTFSAVADPTRRGILDFLTNGEATVRQIVAQFSLTQPTISSHLKVLQGAGLLERRRVAQTRPCRLSPQGFATIDNWLSPYRAIWQANFARLDQVLLTMTKDDK